MKGWLLVLAVLAPLAAGVERAAACSCYPAVDPRRALAHADAAFVGRLVAKKPLPRFMALYTFRVEQVYKGRLGRTVIVLSASSGDACGLEVRIGARTGLFLDRVEGRWRSYLCLQVPPAVLRAAAHGRRTASASCGFR